MLWVTRAYVLSRGVGFVAGRRWQHHTALRTKCCPIGSSLRATDANAEHGVWAVHVFMIRSTELPKAAVAQPLRGPVSSARVPSFGGDPLEHPAPEPVLRRDTMRI